MNEVKKFSLVKPSISTPFHIDFDWWKQHDNNWKVYLFACLCTDHQKALEKSGLDDLLDWVDPQTAEVKTVDSVQHTLINHCARQPEFITGYTTLVDAIFRIFVANGNNAMTPIQLGEKTGRPPETILRTFGGATIYKGIRPVHDSIPTQE